MNDDGDVWLAVQNCQGITVHLDAGVELGTIRPTKVMPLHSDSQPGDTEVSHNAPVEAVEHTPGRLEQLCNELNLPLDTLSPGEAAQLKALVSEFSDIFALSDSELGCTDVLQHHIDTGEHPPIKQQPYRTPAVRREKVSEMIDAMEKQGVVQPSVSPWASPVVLVPKKDGSLRFCVDYRRLNSVTRKDVYPLPRVDDILERLDISRRSTWLRETGRWSWTKMPDRRVRSLHSKVCTSSPVCRLASAMPQQHFNESCRRSFLGWNGKAVSCTWMMCWGIKNV